MFKHKPSFCPEQFMLHDKKWKLPGLFVCVRRIGKYQVILIPAVYDVFICICQMRDDGGYLKFMNGFFNKTA